MHGCTYGDMLATGSSVDRHASSARRAAAEKTLNVMPVWNCGKWHRFRVGGVAKCGEMSYVNPSVGLHPKVGVLYQPGSEG